jgi:YidC/Oxa1 family membrane protein insertase
MILEKLLEQILLFFHQITNSYGISLVLLSLAVSVIMFPLYVFAELLQRNERNRKNSMQLELDQIKDLKNKQEKYYYTKEVYRNNNYKSYYALTGLIGIAVQVPFFIAAYSMLLAHTSLEGISFGPIENLSQPDRIISIRNLSINIIPILMTLVNLLSINLQSKYMNKNETKQLILIAFVLFTLLYNLPAALVLYWTMNNIFAVVKNWLISDKMIKYFNQFKFKYFFKKIHFNLTFLKTYFISLLNKKWFESISLILFLNLVIYVISPVQLISFFGNDITLQVSTIFNIIFKLFFISSLIISVLFMVVNFIITKVLSPVRLRVFENSVNHILVFLFSWITFSGFIFPLLKQKGGMLDPHQIPTDWKNFVLVVFLSGTVTLFYRMKKKSIIYTFFTFFYLIVLINLSWEIPKIKYGGQTKAKTLRLSNESNLLVISFDGLPGKIVDQIFFDYPKLKSSFNDFRYFNNVISTSVQTKGSILTELYGNIDVLKKKYIEDDNFLSKQLLLNSDKNVEISSSGIYANQTLKKSRRMQVSKLGLNNEIYNTYELLSLFEIMGNRVLNYDKWIRYLLKLLPVNENSSQSIRQYYLKNPPSIRQFYLANKIKHKGAKWDFMNLQNLDAYNYWVDNLTVGDQKDTLTVKYYHFNHTHFPVDFDSTGIIKSNDLNWFNNNQNYNGLYNQTYYALTQFVSLINKLKELNVFNKTFIVFKSDHGENSYYFNNYPEKSKINGNHNYGYSRYRPTLLIKDFYSENNSMTTITDLVSLSDLANTINIKFKPYYNHENTFSGINLLEKINPLKSPYIYMNFVKDRHSSFMLKDHYTLRIDRRKSDSLVKLLELNDSIKISKY